MTPEKSVLAYINHLIVSNFSYFCKYSTILELFIDVITVINGLKIHTDQFLINS